jgi:hypothetical protein
MAKQPKQSPDPQDDRDGVDLAAEFDAQARAAAARFDAGAMVGHPLDEAQEYYRERGFPVQMVIPEGGASVLSYVPDRVRLVVSPEDTVTEAFLG